MSEKPELVLVLRALASLPEISPGQHVIGMVAAEAQSRFWRDGGPGLTLWDDLGRRLLRKRGLAWHWLGGLVEAGSWLWMGGMGDLEWWEVVWTLEGGRGEKV
ncbi:hypothetical protein BKA65DRAFT_533649 [Rhexocercosporidium sp. MPI-PUGE-AT-0058]|nr:hypothetical protein BKA65DRAFT_533649 [Rhexocercosporidium sp. MPI-PUGE-AT-0058]